MKLGELKPAPGSTKDTKRRGRGPGSGLGRTGGRGNKGAGQRSGNKHRPWFEGGQMPLLRRLPKRGFSNYPFRKEFQIVNLVDLEPLGAKEITPAELKAAGLIRSEYQPVKILANGELTKAINVSASAFSKSAAEKITKVGGTATVL
ncbi:MAG: 50S ribosomal protein L15 [FCB group bacterium]|nr:50S ribosomal protein L15 [FCB group bacterium]